MTRDYAKRPTTYARKKEQKRGSLLAIIIVALAILLPFSLLYLKHFHVHGFHQSMRLSQARQKIQDLEKTNKNDDLVQFDFYTVLPNREVEISKQTPSEPMQKISIQPVSAKIATPHSPVTTPASVQPIKKEGFFLQTAASRNYSDAQRFVSQLSSIEPHLFIQQIKVDHVFWYRIMAGPYATHEEAVAAQQRLKQYRIRSILAKSKTN